VAEALEALLPLLRRLVPADGLSLPAAATLARISRTGFALRVSDLAAAEGVSQPAMSQLVARLERDGLIARERAADDARASLSSTTAAGEEALRRRRDARRVALLALLEQLSEGEQAALVSAAPALRHVAELAGHQSSTERGEKP